MCESFLSAANTIPHSRRDFAEWHNGISHYGFWAALVEAADWLELVEAARLHVRQFIHPGYQRAPHITVAACGLLSEEHFGSRLKGLQADALAGAEISPFCLTANGLDSFTSAPYITVEDPAGALGRIRLILNGISKEDNPPARYRPHITLGLYQGAFQTRAVADHLKAFRPPPVKPLRVTELAFCSYETSRIQGPFVVLERVALDVSNPMGESPE